MRTSYTRTFKFVLPLEDATEFFDEYVRVVIADERIASDESLDELLDVKIYCSDNDHLSIYAEAVIEGPYVVGVGDKKENDVNDLVDRLGNISILNLSVDEAAAILEAIRILQER